MLTQADLKDRLRLALQSSGQGSSDYDLNPEFEIPDASLREAAVLIAFQKAARGAEVILTKRSSALAHHPGQIAFPGGKFDDNDKSLQSTALREAREEIALAPERVEILGSLPPHLTVTNFQVTPYVGWIDRPQNFNPEPGEVSEVFSVPANFILRPENYRVEGRVWRGQLRRYYAVPYGPYYIWGATARMLRTLAGRMEQ